MGKDSYKSPDQFIKERTMEEEDGLVDKNYWGKKLDELNKKLKEEQK